MSLEEVAKTFVAVAEGLGKSLWVIVLVVVLWTFAFGSESTLRKVGERLQQAGFTTLKTPVGDINTGQIGQLKAASDQSAVAVAELNELARSESDPSRRKALEQVAKRLGTQQAVQISVAENLSARSVPATTPSLSSASSGAVERWIFVGRYSEGAWRPLSFSLGDAPSPLKRGSRIQVKGEALLYGDSNCEGRDVPERVYEAARPTATGLEVVGEPVLCPSVGAGQTVWAKVRVPADLLVTR